MKKALILLVVLVLLAGLLFGLYHFLWTADNFAALGEKAMKSGNYARAVDRYTTAVSLAPDNVDYVLALAAIARELNIRKKQLEDAEIIKSIRSMKLNSRELLVVLDKIQNGTAVFPYLTEETTVPDTKKEEDWKDIAEERKLPGHRAEEKEDEHRENEN